MITILIFLTQLSSGYLSVIADQQGLTVYVDDDSIGVTPITRYELEPNEYDVGFFPQDSIEQASWRLKNGSVGALWKIAKYGEGIVKVKIESNRETVVELNYAAVTKAPGKAKLKVFGCLGGTFIIGILVTLAVQALF